MIRVVPERRRTFATVALAVALALAGTGAVRADPPIWRVDGPHARITLFGSVHLLSDATKWRDAAVDGDLARADEVWFEIPIDAAAQAQVGQLTLARGRLPQGRTLSQILPPDLYARAVALGAKEGLPAASLQPLQPWLAELLLSLLYFQKQGARADLGVEQQVAASAPAAAGHGAFETVAEQVALFADDPLPEQISSLRETLDEIDKDPGIFDRLTRAWAAGDVHAIEREAVDPVRREDRALYERLLVARNHRFAARIAELAQGSKRVFVVVGVGHLVGQDGVPALLRRDGLKVEGP